jgi:hypothetical protein
MNCNKIVVNQRSSTVTNSNKGGLDLPENRGQELRARAEFMMEKEETKQQKREEGKE